jgi:hypothetical protein
MQKNRNKSPAKARAQSKSKSPAKTTKPQKKVAKGTKSQHSVSPRKASPSKGSKKTPSRSNTPAKSKSTAKKTEKAAKPAARKTLKKPNASKDKLNKSVSLIKNDSESEEEDDGDVLYTKDSYITFIDTTKDNDTKFDHFTVGKVIKDMAKDDEACEVQMYHLSKALAYGKG